MNKEYHDNEALKEAKKRTKKKVLIKPSFSRVKNNNKHYNNNPACYGFDIH